MEMVAKHETKLCLQQVVSEMEQEVVHSKETFLNRTLRKGRLERWQVYQSSTCNTYKGSLTRMNIGQLRIRRV